jgi:hypothetical protein
MEQYGGTRLAKLYGMDKATMTGSRTLRSTGAVTDAGGNVRLRSEYDRYQARPDVLAVRYGLLRKRTYKETDASARGKPLPCPIRRQSRPSPSPSARGYVLAHWPTCSSSLITEFDLKPALAGPATAWSMSRLKSRSYGKPLRVDFFMTLLLILSNS